MARQSAREGTERGALQRLKRFGRSVAGLDKRIQASAIGGILIVLATTWLTNTLFKSDEDEIDSAAASLSMPLYISKVRQSACERAALTQQFQAELANAVAALNTARVSSGGQAEISNVTAVFYRVRSAASNGQLLASEVLDRFEGVVPPAQFADDQKQLKDEWQLVRSMLEDLLRALPADIERRSPTLAMEILTAPSLALALSRVSSALSGGGAGMHEIKYSTAFQAVYSCP